MVPAAAAEGLAVAEDLIVAVSEGRSDSESSESRACVFSVEVLGDLVVTVVSAGAAAALGGEEVDMSPSATAAVPADASSAVVPEVASSAVVPALGRSPCGSSRRLCRISAILGRSSSAILGGADPTNASNCSSVIASRTSQSLS